MIRKNSCKRFLSLAIALVCFPVVGLHAEPSFLGPDSVPQYHPLCLDQLKNWQEDGGAFDMNKCAQELAEVKVIETADQSFYAKRAVPDSGYVAYKPIGSLDNAMEVLLVYDKQDKAPLTSIYFIGRIPGAELMRDFLTTVEEGGDRCLGGVNDARLISPSELEVDLNVTTDKILTFLQDEKAESTAEFSLKGAKYQAYACAGTITKTYNLLDNQVRYTRVTFTRDESRKVINRADRCYDQLVASELEAPRVLDMQQYETFMQRYSEVCGAVKR